MLKRALRYQFRGKLPKNTLSFPSFNLRYESNNLGQVAVAVVVSKKVSKLATVRNKLKRSFLEEFERAGGKEVSANLIFYLKKQDLEGAFKKDLEEALSKIK